METLDMVLLVLFIFAVLGWLCFLRALRSYRRAVYAASKGYWAKQSAAGGYRWYAPKPEWVRSHHGVDDGYSLFDAAKRERLIEEQQRLRVPVASTYPEAAYKLGDFAKEDS